MAAASTSTAVRESEESADWDDYLYEDDGNLRPAKQKNPKQQISARAKLDPELWSTLSDNLTEKIIARLPFKAFFRAASLSKTWWLAFRSPSFQREVLLSSSPGWAAYSPLFLNEKEQLLGFDGEAQLWHRLPTHLEYFHRLHPTRGTWRLESSGGPLLCWTSGTGGTLAQHRIGRDGHIHVTNPLNGSWKQLPSPPETRCGGCDFHVVCERDDTYEVILISLKNLYERVDGRLRNGSICARIFDSSSGSWIVSSHNSNGLEMQWGGSVVLNGVIYVLLDRKDGGHQLVSFHVRDRIWNMIASVLEDAEHRSPLSPLVAPQVLDLQGVYFSELVVCGSDIMLVAYLKDWLRPDDDKLYHESIVLFKVDSKLGVAFRLATAPREMLIIGAVHGAVGHGDCLYIFGQYPSSLTIRYDVKMHEWNWASVVSDILSPAVDFISPPRWIHRTYQPGWNPFLKV